MLEGFVRQLILGYLGRYVKDIQKEQLKITLWNGISSLQTLGEKLSIFASDMRVCVCIGVLHVDYRTCAEEVLLENVELSLEAFDYLRLPFALKQGI